MYILLIARGYPTLYDPQYGSFEKDQALALKEAGHRVVVMSVDRRLCGKHRKIGVEHRCVDGIDVYNIFLFPLPLNLCSTVTLFIARCLCVFLYAKVEKEQGRPDIIYSHYMYNTAAAVSLKKRYHIPLVCIEHWSGVNKNELPSYVKKMGKESYTFSDSVITVSDSLRLRLKEHFMIESTVVHNMVSDDFFCNKIVNKDNCNTIQFATVGRLVHLKGMDVLIEAFEKANLAAKWQLLVIGDGEEKDSLLRQVVDAGLTDKVRFLGQKDKLEIVEILCQSSAFILPSRTENFSVAVLEALAVGLPVVATICGGIRECINESNGLLVPVEDVTALSNAIKEMCYNIDNYDRYLIADDCRNEFSSSIISKKLITVFEEVLKNKDIKND